MTTIKHYELWLSLIEIKARYIHCVSCMIIDLKVNTSQGCDMQIWRDLILTALCASAIL